MALNARDYKEAVQMKIANNLILTLTLFAGMCVSSKSTANCDHVSRPSSGHYLAAFDSLVAQGCFGGVNDSTPITKSVGIATI